jgi:hypothetical protein
MGADLFVQTRALIAVNRAVKAITNCRRRASPPEFGARRVKAARAIIQAIRPVPRQQQRAVEIDPAGKALRAHWAS